MLGVGENGDLDLNVEAMVEYEHVFLERKPQLERALNQITTEPLDKNQQDIVQLLNIALSGTGDADEEFQEAMITYVQLIMLRDEQAADRLLEYEGSEELIQFVLNSILEYGEDMQRLNFRNTQGERWWSFVDLDRVVKDTGIRHHHKITIDRSKKIELHSTPHSDWTLVRHILSSIQDSYFMADQDRYQLMNLDTFEQIRGIVYTFEKDLEQNGVELTDKDELVDLEDDPNKQDND